MGLVEWDKGEERVNLADSDTTIIIVARRMEGVRKEAIIWSTRETGEVVEIGAGVCGNLLEGDFIFGGNVGTVQKEVNVFIRKLH